MGFWIFNGGALTHSFVDGCLKAHSAGRGGYYPLEEVVFFFDGAVPPSNCS